MSCVVTDSAGMRNRLDEETSPYLKQHAANPVHWQPWDAAALAAARDSGKPILLSVGYSACHWCHVMAHESFEDDATARLMNELFVNIKVDREERPDLDKIYQTAHHLYTGRPGGWPLTVFLTPDTHIPIFTGTYFPKDRRYGMPAFREVLAAVDSYFRTQGDEIRRRGAGLIDALGQVDTHSGGRFRSAHAHAAPERAHTARAELRPRARRLRRRPEVSAPEQPRAPARALAREPRQGGRRARRSRWSRTR